MQRADRRIPDTLTKRKTRSRSARTDDRTIGRTDTESDFQSAGYDDRSAFQWKIILSFHCNSLVCSREQMIGEKFTRYDDDSEDDQERFARVNED